MEYAIEPLLNRHDHGSQYMSDDYQAEIAFLGMQSSPSFVRQPECNGCVERFIRTLKEQLLWSQVIGRFWVALSRRGAGDFLCSDARKKKSREENLNGD